MPRRCSRARQELGRFPALLDGLLAGLSPATWRARPAPDEWAPVEIVCHLRDEEVEDFGARVRVVLGGGGAFAPIDPEGWAKARRYRDADPGGALAAFREERRASLALLAAASPEGLPPPARVRPASGSRASTSWRPGSRTTASTSASSRAP